MATDSNTLTLELTNDLTYVVDNIQPQGNGPISLSTSFAVSIPFTGTPASILNPNIVLTNDNYIPVITISGEGWSLKPVTPVGKATEYIITHSTDVKITIKVDKCRVLYLESNETDTGGGGIAMVGTVSMIVAK